MMNLNPIDKVLALIGVTPEARLKAVSLVSELSDKIPSLINWAVKTIQDTDNRLSAMEQEITIARGEIESLHTKLDRLMGLMEVSENDSRRTTGVN